ncbi:MAG: hypothetical protein ACJ72W_07725 [Actinoallomurus sp.]
MENWYSLAMGERWETPEEIEVEMARTRRALRTAALERDDAQTKRLRAELRRLNNLWEDKVREEAEAGGEGRVPSPSESLALAPVPEPESVAALLPAREQVHQVLSLLTVPAAPKLITAVHAAFFSGDLPAARLASLRRDEERSYRAAPNARPYYLCPALTADLLAPARALLTVSTWPLERRIIGAYSPRVDFLTAAIKIAATVVSHRELGEGWAPDAMARAERLLRSFAVSIPGALPPAAGGPAPAMDPEHVAKAAQTELAVHAETDQHERGEAATRARRQLTDIDRLFGTRLTLLQRQANIDT